MQDRPFTQRYDPAAGLLTLGGSVDDRCMTELRACLEKAVASPVEGAVTVDLCDVDFLPSVGVGELARARQRCLQEGVDIRFRASEGSAAATVLRVTGLGFVSMPSRRRERLARRIYSEPPSSSATES